MAGNPFGGDHNRRNWGLAVDIRRQFQASRDPAFPPDFPDLSALLGVGSITGTVLFTFSDSLFGMVGRFSCHRSFSTSERLAPFAIFSSVFFSDASKDSASDGAATGCAAFRCIAEMISGSGDSGEFFISIRDGFSQAHHGRPRSRVQKCRSRDTFDDGETLFVARLRTKPRGLKLVPWDG
jgi:hypothetical protein